MLMTDVTHPHQVLTSGPPQLPNDAANTRPNFLAAGAAHLTIEHLDTKMCSMVLKAITDPEFNQHLAHIANDTTKLKGR